MEQKTQQLNNFYCISLVFNPLVDDTPEIFKTINKQRKDKFTHDILRDNLSGLYQNIVLLKTCQRIEMYILTEGNVSEIEIKLYELYKNYFSDDYFKNVKIYPAKDGMIHLIRLVSGLESFIVGESEIYDQVKNLSEKYHEDGLSNDYLNDLFVKSLKIGKEIKDGVLNKNHIQSYPQILLEFIKDKGVHNKNILILGNGLLSQTISKFLLENNIQINLYNPEVLVDWNEYDLIVNCDSKIDMDIFNIVKAKTFVDFSISPLFPSKIESELYFSIRDFKEILYKNNDNLKSYILNATKYIDEELGKN